MSKFILILSAHERVNSKNGNAQQSALALRTRELASWPAWLPVLIKTYYIRNIAEQLIEKGLASVVRHRRDDEDRSADFDKLITAEQTWVGWYIV